MQDLPGVSEPSREHVEAVAVDLHDRLCDGGGGCAGVTDDDRRTAEALLTSTWLPVLDAMQDALVRAGRLRVDESAAYSDDDGETWYAMFGRAPSRQPMRRLVTEWTEVMP